MKSLRSRLEALEHAARFVSDTRQLDILIAALDGDAAAATNLEQLRSRGALAGRLGEVFDALHGPFETEKAEDPTPQQHFGAAMDAVNCPAASLRQPTL